MPIFEYACRRCGHRFETLVRGSSSPTCPSCNGQELEQQLSVFAVGAKSASPRVTGDACGSSGDPRSPGTCALD